MTQHVIRKVQHHLPSLFVIATDGAGLFAGGVLSETTAVAAEAAGHQRNSTTPPPRPPSSAAATAPGSAEVAPSPSSAALPSSSVLGASHAGPGGVAKAPSGLVLGGPPEKVRILCAAFILGRGTEQERFLI